MVHRLLGAWSVDTILVRRGPQELFAAARAGEDPPRPATIAGNPFTLPWARVVPVASLFPNGGEALDAALAQGLEVGRREFLVTGESGSEIRFDPDAAVVAVSDGGDRIRVEIAARGPSLLVIASTYDPGWRAEIAGEPLAVLESGLGYLAVPVPPGGGAIELAYGDPWVRRGALLSLAGLVALALLTAWSVARRRHGRP